MGRVDKEQFTRVTACWLGMKNTSFNKVVVDTAALENNFRCLQKLSGPDVPVMAMVKADAYGHGMGEAAKAFSRAGCSRFGVAEIHEGVALRKSGIEGEIYVATGFHEAEAGLFFQYDLIPVIYSIAAARALSAQGALTGRTIGVHIKLDSGMSRLGILPGELYSFLDALETLPGVRVAGLMSHFPEADLPGTQSTIKAIEVFSSCCKEIKKRLGGICHIANSGAVINFPDACFDMVRAGIALYGYHPAGREHKGERVALPLVPAMSVYSRVLQVKELGQGVGVSYGHTFITDRPMKLAVLPVGYANGYSRHLSNKGEVIVKGKKAVVCGRVCMNLCMVDVTDIDGVCEGSEVVLMGSQGASVIDADDLAEQIGSISYEVLCMLGNNNFREYQVG